MVHTSLRDSNSLDKYLSKKSFIKLDCPSDVVMVDICGHTDRVCHGRENAPQYFFFVYNTFISDLHMTLPFDAFTMRVLQILNVAHTQPHPNSWAALQAFRVVCDIFILIPTPHSFLFYYSTHLSNPVSWLSLLSRPGNVRFVAFTTSYKNVKEK